MSVFLDMAHVIDEELIAGRISVIEAKTRLAINFDIAVMIEVSKREKYLGHTSADWKRDKKLDETFYCRQTR